MTEDPGQLKKVLKVYGGDKYMKWISAVRELRDQKAWNAASQLSSAVADGRAAYERRRAEGGVKAGNVQELPQVQDTVDRLRGDVGPPPPPWRIPRTCRLMYGRLDISPLHVGSFFFLRFYWYVMHTTASGRGLLVQWSGLVLV